MAGFLGMGGYDKAGPGVARNERKKNNLFAFLEQFFKRIWKLLALNIIYVIFCIPILTIGPATAAFTKVLRNYAIGRHAFLWSDFIKAFKENFNKAFVMGIVDVAVCVLMFISIPAYNRLSEGNPSYYIPFLITLSCLIIFYMMHFYIYLMIVTTNLSLKDIIKNALKLTSLGLVPNLWTLLVSFIVIGLVVLFFPYSIFVLPFGVLSFLGFVICFNSFPVLRKFVILPYYKERGEKMPELSYVPDETEAEPDKEAVFTDMGGKEKPVDFSKKKGKGKTIS